MAEAGATADVRVSGYEILELLGQSDTGPIVKARQTSLERLVALKVLPAEQARDESFSRRFLEEARAAADLRHPNVVAVVDQGVCRDTGAYYIAFEFVDGVSLERLLTEQGGRLTERDALLVCEGLAHGLVLVEAQGLVHRDIKPTNVVVSRQGVPKLAELGLAKRKDQTGVSMVGAILGTAHYIAPELALGLGDVDTRSDLYALGVTLFRCLTGALPFEGTEFLSIVTQHVNQDLPDPREVNPKVSQEAAHLVSGLSGRDPADRYPTARAACFDFDRTLRGLMPLGPAEAGVASDAWSRPERDLSSLAAMVRVVTGEGTASPTASRVPLDDAEPDPPFTVRVRVDGEVRSEVRFDQDLVVLGRGKEADVRIDDNIVSRRHVEIHRNGDQFGIRALPTTNGTTVDGAPLDGLLTLDLSELIVVADKYDLEIAPEEAEDATPIAGVARPLDTLRPDLDPVGATAPQGHRVVAEEPEAPSAEPAPAAPDPEAGPAVQEPDLRSWVEEAQAEEPPPSATFGWVADAADAAEEASTPYATPPDDEESSSPYAAEAAESPYATAEPSPSAREPARSAAARAPVAAPDEDEAPATAPEADAAQAAAGLDEDDAPYTAPEDPEGSATDLPPYRDALLEDFAPPAPDRQEATRELPAAGLAGRGRGGEVADAVPERPTEPLRRDRPAAAASLLVTRNGHEERVRLGDTLQVGKSRECDLRISGTFAPRKAALIVRVGGDYRLFNVGPAPNTVSVNGEEVSDSVRLEPGDEVSVYGLALRFAP